MKSKNKKGIGYSPLTDKVYIGNQNLEKRMWVGEKTDITNDFIAVSYEYFAENTIRTITDIDGSSTLFINVKNNKAGLELVLKKLTKLLNELK